MSFTSPRTHDLVAPLSSDTPVSAPAPAFLPAVAEADSIRWSSPEANLWVANQGGEYAGMVEFTDGHFLSRDRTGNLIDRFTDIPSAQLSVQRRSAVKRSRLAAAARYLRSKSVSEDPGLLPTNPNYRRHS